MTTAVLNTKISEVENKIPDTGGLVTATVLNTKIEKVENITPNVTDLVEKRQIMTLKYQTLRKQILELLIIINLRATHLMQR